MDNFPSTPIQLIRQVVRPYRLKTFLFFALTFLGQLAWTASPLIIALIVNVIARESQVTAEVWWLVALYGLLRYIDELLWRGSEWLMRSYQPQLQENVRTVLYSSVLRRNHSFYVNSSSGRVGFWINQTVKTVRDFIDTTIWTVWGRVTSLVTSAVFLFIAHWTLALLFIVWLTLLFIYQVKRGRKFSQLVAKQSDEESIASSTIVDSIANHLSVRAYNSQGRELKLLDKQQEKIVSRHRDSWWHNLVTNMVKGQSAAFSNILALILVIYLFQNGSIEIGHIVLFIVYFTQASSTLWQLAWSFDFYYRSFGAIQNALDGLKGNNERDSAKHTDYKIPSKIEIELNELNFAYPDQPELPVLSDINLRIPQGMKIGLVGHSGAGKSTLASMLLGLYEPSSGEILINSQPTSKHDPKYLRACIAYVPQETGLFNRTVRENVTYAVGKASDDKIWQALEKAEATSFVKKMPDGLDTIIGERGVKLSGGQKQRIAIARAILQDTPVVLLDEATSALDSVSEQAIQKALQKLIKNKTAIVIAHRLSTLKHLDMIVVVEDGKIIEKGSHMSLLRSNGIYADLWARQKDGFIGE